MSLATIKAQFALPQRYTVGRFFECFYFLFSAKAVPVKCIGIGVYFLSRMVMVNMTKSQRTDIIFKTQNLAARKLYLRFFDPV